MVCCHFVRRLPLVVVRCTRGGDGLPRCVAASGCGAMHQAQGWIPNCLFANQRELGCGLSSSKAVEVVRRGGDDGAALQLKSLLEALEPADHLLAPGRREAVALDREGVVGRDLRRRPGVGKCLLKTRAAAARAGAGLFRCVVAPARRRRDAATVKGDSWRRRGRRGRRLRLSRLARPGGARACLG